MDSLRIVVDQETCCPDETTAAEAAPRRMAHTTKSSRKCCRLGTTVAGYLAALLALVLYLAPHCHSMPVTTPDGLAENWWHTPCRPIDTAITATSKPVRAGGQMKSFRRTKTQLQLAHGHYKTLPLKSMYRALEDDHFENEYHWLPKTQLEWFMKEFGREDSNVQEVAPKVLFQLHEDLQKFAVTLDKLYHHKYDEEDIHFGRRRANTLFELCLELKKVLCEVEASLATAGKEPPRPSLNSSLIPEDKWNNRRDKAFMLIQDRGLLEAYGKFLVDWRLIVEKLLETNSGAKRRKLREKGPKKNRRRPNGNNKKGGRRGHGLSSSQEEQRVEESAAGGGAGRRRMKKGKGGRSGERRAERRREQQQQRPARPGTSAEQ